MSSRSMTVKDVVIPLRDYPHIRENQELHDAIEALRSSTCKDHDHLRFKEILVLNREGFPVGLVSIKNILEGLEPRLLKREKLSKYEGVEIENPDLAILWEDTFAKECRQRANRPVMEFLSPIGMVVKESDSVLKVLYIMLHKEQTSLPVIDTTGGVVGMVRMKEIFDALCSYCEL